MLSDNGLWVRRRNGEWQMKVRRGGDRLNSQFEEVSDLDTISKAVETLTRKEALPTNNFGLGVLADFSTTRRSWLANHAYNIVLDRTDFNHEVGEVELEIDMRVQDDAEAALVMKDMDWEIARFLERYRWAFDNAVPVGKLTAYLERVAGKSR